MRTSPAQRILLNQLQIRKLISGLLSGAQLPLALGPISLVSSWKAWEQVSPEKVMQCLQDSYMEQELNIFML